jgi:transcriptional regulator with XRE-family HTH domain
MDSVELKRARRAAGWTQARLAAEIGKTAGTVAVWERAARRIPLAAQIAIRSVLAGARAISDGALDLEARGTKGVAE